MRDAAALALLVAAIAVPRTTGFSIATVPAAPRLRARVCGRGALAVQAVLDKMGKAAIGAVGKAAANAPLPTSPRPQEILDAATTGEVADSLDRFVKSAPEGLLRSGKLLSEKVLPVAADLLFNAKAQAEASEDAAPEEPLPAGWTAHLDNKTGMTYYFEEATATAVWTRPSESPRQPASEGATAGSTEQQLSVARDVPDSSADLRDLQRLMQVSVAGDFASDSADGGEGDATKAVDINNMESLSLSWDEDDDEEEAPSWMLDSSSYKPD